MAIKRNAVTGKTAPPSNTSSSSSSATAGWLPEINITSPTKILRHNISDEDLDVLVSANRDGLSDRMWGAFGIAAGLAGPCSEALYEAFVADPKVPLNAFHLAELFVFVGALAVAATIYKISGSRESRATAKAAEIRSRPVQ